LVPFPVQNKIMKTITTMYVAHFQHIWICGLSFDKNIKLKQIAIDIMGQL
jgi:hypothetical protein